jgi:hypothetical protein
MTTGAGSSGWTPPALESLDFSTDCDLVGKFFQAWFDTTPGFDHIPSLPDGNSDIRFWFPTSLGTNITKRYFDKALPDSTLDYPTYAQTLDWEYSWRADYVAGISHWVEKENDPSRTEAHPFFNTSYFDLVIDKPGSVCKKEACAEGFNWGRLIAINGPGVSCHDNTFGWREALI